MGNTFLADTDIAILLGPNYVPEGKYNVSVHDLSLNMTKNNDHYYIIAVFEIIEGAFRGRTIKQIWSFREGQEYRTSARINNFFSKVGAGIIATSNGTICSMFNLIQSKLQGKSFIAQYIKNIDNRSELLYAEKSLF